MRWPALPYAEWSDTCETLQLWTQIIGKIRLQKMPLINHWWQVTLYVTSRGLGTSPIPDGSRTLDIDFDFLTHQLTIVTSDGQHRQIKLQPMTVAAFYEKVMAALRDLRVDVKINTLPSEVANPIHFEKDDQHKSYDADAASRFWRILVSTCQVMTQFRSRFIGKVSPVHFFWGGFDMAVTRFSGRRAPVHGPMPGLPDFVVREAYSHEVSSAGFWPGGAGSDAAFYAYAYPQPQGFAKAAILPASAFYSDQFGEFLLPYEAVRTARLPEADLMNFLESTYDAAAGFGRWPREELERQGAIHGVA